MKKLNIALLIVLGIVLLSLAGCGCQKSNVISNDNLITQKYKTGEQIELYINSASKPLSDFIDLTAVDSVAVADSSVAEIVNEALVPKKEGFTYISCKKNDEIKNYNVVVYGGAEYVTSCTISGKAGETFDGYIGRTYQIETTN